MEKCCKCNKEMSLATEENLNGLIWNDKIQDWICPKCDKIEANKKKNILQ